MKEKSIYKQWKDGEITGGEYNDYKSQKKGYKDYNEYQREQNHMSGRYQSMSKNRECAQYLGVHIVERILSKIWDNVTRMPNGNRGYDFICGKGFKVDVKSSCLDIYGYLYFHIRRNKIADYFLLVGFDNREDLNPTHIWLIKGEQQILCINVNDRVGVSISDSNIYLFKKYEQTNKMEKLKECCNTLKVSV